jgi:mRNA-degrading endonuclease RelE of RelBE toxin-antitoxin system
LLRRAVDELQRDPLAESKNQKTLRPNRIAQRELRLLGKYRVLYSVEENVQTVTIILVGEKRGSGLVVGGVEFTEHDESDSTE